MKIKCSKCGCEYSPQGIKLHELNCKGSTDPALDSVLDEKTPAVSTDAVLDSVLDDEKTQTVSTDPALESVLDEKTPAVSTDVVLDSVLDEKTPAAKNPLVLLFVIILIIIVACLIFFRDEILARISPKQEGK